MTRKAEFIALLLADATAVCLASAFYYLARFQWGWFDVPQVYPEPIPVVVALAAYWLLVFFFFGMYRERYASSRFDELVSLMKVVSVGILVLVFAIFIDILQPGSTRALIFYYWLDVFLLVALGRTLVRTVQKVLILSGYGTHKALIVGWSDRVEQLHEDIARYPAAGLNVVGALRIGQRENRLHRALAGHGQEEDDEPVVESFQDIEMLPDLIDELDVQDVLIAIGADDQQSLVEVLRLCDGKPVSLKLVPDFYSVLGGMARTEHLYGLPLIEVLPEPMQPWEESTKRIIDVVVSLLVLVLGLPFWVLLIALIRLTSKGPAIYRQQRVGLHGRVFTMYKFRTMRRDAEAATGPVWASEDDPRYTPLGRWLRKTRLDEVPQFFNVLKGEMSLVGPRPERPYFVDRLSHEIPLYNRRSRVKPGITGWAQVIWRYDASLSDVKQKVKYDLFYIANMSLRMDFKILFMTIKTAFLGKGR
ncbi:MAG: sugar transferase [Rhodothermales bacterium]